MEEIKGFKAFKQGLRNKYGASFEMGMLYSQDCNSLQFGEQGHGYHIASHLADTFRFFHPQRDNVYCEVLGFGNRVKADNYLYNCADMYVVEKFKITKVLSRKDIMEYVYQSNLEELKRFLALYPFTKEELEILRTLVVEKGSDYESLFNRALSYQQDVVRFQRNREYLRR